VVAVESWMVSQSRVAFAEAWGQFGNETSTVGSHCQWTLVKTQQTKKT
jgi:hypothetical protein